MLPVSEWPRLSQTDAGTPWTRFDPVRDQVLVVEDGAQIVGTVSLVPLLHVEGLWVHPAYRQRDRVLGRLWRGVRAGVRGHGFRSFWSGSVSEQMTAILYRLGAVKVPGFSYVVRVKES